MKGTAPVTTVSAEPAAPRDRAHRAPSLLRSSVVTKLVLAVTGLCLFLFLLAHLAGNLLLLAGPGAFNAYAHRLAATGPLLWVAELVLLGLFGIHVVQATRSWLRNRAARPVAYSRRQGAGHTSRKSLASSSMIVSGLVTLVFVASHLKTFKWGRFYRTPDGMRDLYRLVQEVFAQPLYVAFYVLAMLVLGMHLRHGVASAFQSLGVDHPALTPRLVFLCKLVAALVALGFAFLPLYMYLGRTP